MHSEDECTYNCIFQIRKCPYYGVKNTMKKFRGTILEFPIYRGKVVKSTRFGRNKSGYDLFIIEFDDNTFIEILEQGQVGYFSVNGELTEHE